MKYVGLRWESFKSDCSQEWAGKETAFTELFRENCHT